MLHPSYTDLMNVVNSDVEIGEQPVVKSRYSIVMATSKRARQIIEQRSEEEKANAKKDGEKSIVVVNDKYLQKPLSKAVDELYRSKIHILSEEEVAEYKAEKERKLAEKEKQQEE